MPEKFLDICDGEMENGQMEELSVVRRKGLARHRSSWCKWEKGENRRGLSAEVVGIKTREM